MVRIPRNATCVSLGLSDDLSCVKCRNFTGILLDRPSANRTIKTACENPWVLKGGRQENRHVRTANEINQYLANHPPTVDRNVNDSSSNGRRRKRRRLGDNHSTNDGDGNIENIHPNTNNPPVDPHYDEDGSWSDHVMTNVPVLVVRTATNDHPINKFAEHHDDDDDDSDDNDDDDDDDGDDEEDDEEDDDSQTDEDMSIDKIKRKRVVGTRCIMFGRHIINDVPNNAVIITKNYFVKLQAGHQNWTKILRATSSKRCTWNADAKNFVAAAVSTLPKESMQAVARSIPPVIAAFLTTAGVPFSCEGLARSCPSAWSLTNWVIAFAAEVLACNVKEIQNAPAVALSIDKGERSKLPHHPKLLSYNQKPSDPDNGVSVILLDNDPSKGDTASVASAITYSVDNKIGRVYLPCFVAQSTDAGGGGVTDCLHEHLEGHGLCNKEYYFVIQCALHNLQNALKNGIELVFGTGGLDKRNLMQLLHSLWDLQKQYGDDELAATWKHVIKSLPLSDVDDDDNDDDPIDDDVRQLPPNKIQKAVLTRWWYVVCAAQHLKENWDMWVALVDATIAAEKHLNSARGKIATYLQSVLKEKKIKADMLFVCSFGKSFFMRHFAFLQSEDYEARTYGFKSRSMIEWIYIAQKELEELTVNFNNHPDFAEWRAFVAGDLGRDDVDDDLPLPPNVVPSGSFSPVDCLAQPKIFFQTFIKTFFEYFDNWFKNDNVNFAMIGDDECVTAIAAVLVHDRLPDADQAFFSDTHNCVINLREYVLFVLEKRNRQELRDVFLYKRYTDAYRLIADGASLWNSDDNAIIGELRTFARGHMIIVMHTTHRTEAAVREVSLVSTTTKRSDRVRSALCQIRTLVVQSVNAIVTYRSIGKERRANQHMSAGVQGTREVRSAYSRRRHKGRTETIVPSQTQVGTANNALRLDYIQHMNKLMKNTRLFDRPAIRKKGQEMYSTENRVYKKQCEEAAAMAVIRAEDNIDRAPNKQQRQSGVTVTPCTQGHIEWGWLNAADHRNRIIAEINARDEDALSSVGTQWNKLRQLMAKLDGATDGKSRGSFCPRTEWFKDNQRALVDAFTTSDSVRTS